MRASTSATSLIAFVLAGCAAETSAPSDAVDEVAADLNAKQFRYTQIDITAAPPNVDGWFPRGLSDHGEVIGQAFDCNEDFSVCLQIVVKRRVNGQFTVLEEDFVVNDVNSRGDSGGCTTHPVNFEGQAGIVRVDGRLELIPPLPGEMSSCVVKVSDSGIAFVASTDPDFVTSAYVFDRGRIRPFTVQNSVVNDINDHAQFAGIQFFNPNRAYRFDARAQTTTLLEPVAPDPQSWGFAINRQGEVLGTSFAFDASVQRIGKWNRKNQFETSIVGGTGNPEFPVITNTLHWNEQGLIVLSNTDDGNAYLVPSPGVRLNLADLVRNGPVASLLQGIAVNKRGDIVAAGGEGLVFLFRRD
jgi:hypothetical protein